MHRRKIIVCAEKVVKAQDMASAQQLIGLVKSHAEGDEERFFDLAMQLASAEEQRGHNRLAEQLRQWAEASRMPKSRNEANLTPLAAPRGDLAGILGARYPTTQISGVILPDHLSDELHQVVVETRKRDLLEAKGLQPRRRLLFSGPPGTGKTLSAEALAGELKFPLFTVLLHGLITKYMGETAQKLRLIFDAIRTTRGVYLFDEIDALAASRGNDNDIGEARRILNSFLQFLDEDTGPSIVVATTNIPEILDRAVLRRFDLVLPYELPSSAAVQKAMKRRLIGFNVDSVDWGAVSRVAEGLSTADVVAAGEDAGRRAVLSSGDKIETETLIASMGRRRALQGLGTPPNGSKSPSSARKRSRSGSGVSGERRRSSKSTE